LIEICSDCVLPFAVSSTSFGSQRDKCAAKYHSICSCNIYEPKREIYILIVSGAVYSSSWLEESIAYKTVYNNSQSLDLTYDDPNSDEQLVAIRFIGVSLPHLAYLDNAFIRLTALYVSYFPVTLRIWAERTGNSKPFSGTDQEVSKKSRTAACVDWSVPDWTISGESTANQQSPDLSPVLQEIVSLPDWQVRISLHSCSFFSVHFHCKTDLIVKLLTRQNRRSTTTSRLSLRGLLQTQVITIALRTVESMGTIRYSVWSLPPIVCNNSQVHWRW
jgi:hypothetical protein